jgi:hypothetical protein
MWARKLNNLPNSLFDYNDAKRRLEPPAEIRARERRDNRRPDRPTAIKRVALPPKRDSDAPRGRAGGFAPDQRNGL